MHEADPNFKEFDGGYVTFGGGANGGRITGKGTIKIDKLDFEDVYFVKELKFNLFSVSQMCDKKNYVLFTDSECLVLSPNFKLPDESHIENLVDKKVKIIRSDNGTEFKNHVMDEFCREKGIKREYSVARTPQQNGVAERKNRTLIEAARTMLADSKLPTTFWAEAVFYCFFMYMLQGLLLMISAGLMGPIPITEDTQEEDQGIDLGNLSPSYAVSSTPHKEFTRIIQLIISIVMTSVIGSTKKELCEEFEKLMRIKLQMSFYG
ncbi:ribonuclease H-like domain-containing protein [Tanacetum coccineum]